MWFNCLFIQSYQINSPGHLLKWLLDITDLTIFILSMYYCILSFILWLTLWEISHATMFYSREGRWQTREYVPRKCVWLSNSRDKAGTQFSWGFVHEISFVYSHPRGHWPFEITLSKNSPGIILLHGTALMKPNTLSLWSYIWLRFW